MTTKDEDEISFLKTASTHDTLLFFTDRGRVFGAKVYEIPESSRTSKGQALVNIINLEQGEEIRSILPMEASAQHLIMVTTNGTIKKTKLSEFSNLRANGLIAIRLNAQVKLVSVAPTTGNDHVLLLTRGGKSIRFKESDARAMGRATTGVRGILLTKGDQVIGMEVFAPELAKNEDGRKKIFRDVLTISEHGIGKRTSIADFPTQKRGGQGVKAAVVNDKTGPLTTAIMVTEDVTQLVITSKFGQVIKLPRKNIPQMGRSTQGVILMRFADMDDSVAAVTTLEKGGEEE
jgi:DNA gyrase subunit A